MNDIKTRVDMGQARRVGMEHKAVQQEDVERVRNHMMLYHCGFRRACTRQSIAQALGMNDRYFRNVCAEIPEIITSIHCGYWILPLVDASGEEVRRAKEVLKQEDRRRIIALYLRNRKQFKAVRKLEGAQCEFAFTA